MFEVGVNTKLRRCGASEERAQYPQTEPDLNLLRDTTRDRRHGFAFRHVKRNGAREQLA